MKIGKRGRTVGEQKPTPAPSNQAVREAVAAATPRGGTRTGRLLRPATEAPTRERSALARQTDVLISDILNGTLSVAPLEGGEFGIARNGEVLPSRSVVEQLSLDEVCRTFPNIPRPVVSWFLGRISGGADPSAIALMLDAIREMSDTLPYVWNPSIDPGRDPRIPMADDDQRAARSVLGDEVDPHPPLADMQGQPANPGRADPVWGTIGHIQRRRSTDGN